jgi:hypothetical protein
MTLEGTIFNRFADLELRPGVISVISTSHWSSASVLLERL